MFKDILGKVAHAAWARNDAQFLESFRPNHIASKQFLVKNILKVKNSFENVAVLGSWNGILLYELLKDHVAHWHFYDLSARAHHERDRYFELNEMPVNYIGLEGDVTELFELDSLAREYDLIINPSCEHMDDIRAVKGPLYALTSNNYTEVPEHINTVEHEEDLAVKNNINDIRFKGKIQIEKPIPYERYCVIGYA